LARKILLADDSVTAQNMGRKILSDAGYEVITVNNGSAALKKIAEQKPDLVVLDVYMPGYSGLEVCQRVKEMAETAKIPVLLTVGKLEPFKPDEVRRVCADAFIVKPFEASELLTALTQLEDKIVPQAAPPRPGRLAKARTAAERSEPGDRFGDTEKGWKNRLIIPSPKTQEAEADAPQGESIASRELGRDEDVIAAEPNRLEHSVRAGLPADITAEEIAAIAAAAAAFDQPEAPTAPPLVTAQTEPAESGVSDGRATDVPGVRFASAAEARSAEAGSAEAGSAEPGSEKTGSAETGPEAARAKAAVSQPALEGGGAAGKSDESAAAATAETPPTDPAKAVAEATPAESEKPAAADVELLAAIASLAPTIGHDPNRVPPTESGASRSAQKSAEIPVTPAAVLHAEVTVASGTRWIAEPIRVGEDESTCLLEWEMEKAYAAWAAAEAGRNSFAAAAAAGIASAAILSASPSSAPVPAAGGEGTPAECAPVAAMSVAEVTPPTAAAAKRSESPPAPQEADHQREADLAAAWANWSQIRESIVGSHFTSQMGEAAPAELNPTPREEPTPARAEPAVSGKQETAAEPANDGSANASLADSAALAGIVDKMLAELKPKLIEEIAKKMNSERKKKKKE
jgi:CheY-like chemotaxis protein